MRGKIKTARRKASKLHGATATWLSLVDAGANETPFKMIKSRNGAKAMTIKKRNYLGGKKAAATKSHKPLSRTKKGDEEAETRTETLIAKMVFDGDIFATEEEVRDYIEKAEWDAEEINIIETDDGFEARSGDLTDDDFEKIGKVDTDEEGVEAFVGQRTVEVTTKDADDDEEDEEDDENAAAASSETKSEDDEVGEPKASKKTKAKKKPAPKPKYSKRQEFINQRVEAKKASTLTKFDAWDARFSRGNTLAKALRDGMAYDATPPGYYEVQAAFNAAVANIISGENVDSDKQEALNKAASNYAEIIGGLDVFFDQYVESDQEDLEKAFVDEDTRKAVAKWAAGYADFVAGEATQPEPVKKATSEGDAAIDYSKVTETVQDIISKAMGPLAQGLEDVSERVEAISTRAPTKKAADPEDGGAAGPRTVSTKSGENDSKEDAEVKRFAKSFLG